LDSLADLPPPSQQPQASSENSIPTSVPLTSGNWPCTVGRVHQMETLALWPMTSHRLHPQAPATPLHSHRAVAVVRIVVLGSDTLDHATAMTPSFSRDRAPRTGLESPFSPLFSSLQGLTHILILGNNTTLSYLRFLWNHDIS
jgi:hypothetical protein